MIVDGKAIAKDILRKVKERLQGRSLTVRVIVMAPTPVTESYLKIKERAASDAGMRLEVVRIENDATTEDVVEEITQPGADAIVVQLPLPAHINTKRVFDAIPLSADADMLSDASLERYEGEGIVAPVAESVREVFERYEVETADKKAVVVGEGKLVGKPVARLLHSMGAQVLTMNVDTWHVEHLKDADIVVTGAGKAGLIQPEMLKEGVVLIDAGASESGGSIKGDADPACAKVASVFTPVPGGVGPIAVACLFKNVASLAQ
jgi:methylenetetrahydrofolate dehydrogenase (NADP+) / methenyltetrahydrofolate cyclohydrolase